MISFNKRAIIVCAAIRSGVTIIAGARHFDKNADRCYAKY